MRPPTLPDSLIHLSPPLSSTTSACDGPSCRLRPYAGTGDFETNAAMILIILLCALICALALNTAIRCFLRSQDHDLPRSHHQQQTIQQQKTTVNSAAASLEGAPVLVYSAGMKVKLAGEEAECAICLSEFEEGESLRVMPSCRHGFHHHCIFQWLSSHSSCPTCRSSCLPPAGDSREPAVAEMDPEQLI
ncbi:hypothetical protein UlMin_001377 [Ulmus minor]